MRKDFVPDSANSASSNFPYSLWVGDWAQSTLIQIGDFK